MSVANYIWGLIPAAFKHDSQRLREWVAGIADVYEDARSTLYAMRRAWVLVTASGTALDMHGRLRGLPRTAAESDDSYRVRLVGAYLVGLNSNTLQGMLDLLQSVGLSGDVYEHFHDPLFYYDGAYTYSGALRYDGTNRWAEFSVLLDAPPLATELALLLAGVARIKPAHARLAAVVFALPAADSAAADADDAGQLLVLSYDWFDGLLSYDGTDDYAPQEEHRAF